MASCTADHVKAGYWFSTSELKVSNIKSTLFTHLYAGFAKVQYPIPPGSDVIIFPDNTGNFENFPETVKEKNDSVKALLSIGGEGADVSRAIAPVVGDVEKGLRNRFISQSIELAKEHKYDGLDLCWQYRPSTTKQWEDLALFFKDWRRAVEEDAAKSTNTLLLTATVFYLPPEVDDEKVGLFTSINDNLDWINVLAIDFYTPDYSNSPQKTGPVHAWITKTNRMDLCGSAGIQHWIAKEVAAQKLVLCLPFYGYQWILKNAENSGFFAPADRPVPYTNPILYRNIPKDYETNYVEDYVATYSHKEKIWIGHDDKSSISEKVKQAIHGKHLRGYFAWHLDGDDYDDDDKWTLSNAAFDACPSN